MYEQAAERLRLHDYLSPYELGSGTLRCGIRSPSPKGLSSQLVGHQYQRGTTVQLNVLYRV